MKLSSSLFLPLVAAAFLSGAEDVSAQDVVPERSARAKAAAPQGHRAPNSAERRSFAAKKKAKGAKQHRASFGQRNLKELIFEKQKAVEAIKAKMRAAKAAGMSAKELQKIERQARAAKQALAKAQQLSRKGQKASPKRVETRKAKEPAIKKGRTPAGPKARDHKAAPSRAVPPKARGHKAAPSRAVPPKARAHKAGPPKSKVPVKQRKSRAPGERR